MNKIKFNENIEIMQNSRNVITVYVNGISSGWELNTLFRSDEHFDSPYCNRQLLKNQMDKIKEDNGMIFSFGDLFDAMQGHYDPRRMNSELRPEYKVDNYLDEIVTDNARFHAPYAKNLVLVTPGNHEKSILKANGVDLTSNFAYRMNSDHGGHVLTGCYGGYIRFIFNSGRSQSLLVKYFHGHNLSFSRGQVDKQGSMYPDADIIVNGHAHDAWYVPVSRERMSERGVIYKDIQHHLRTSSYKDDYGDGGDGFAVENGHRPSPNGAALVKFCFDNHRVEVEITQKVK